MALAPALIHMRCWLLLTGNLHPDCAERDEAWVFLGFIPPLKSPGTSHSEAAKRYRLQYYHDALRFLLQPLVTCHKDGGFALTIEGRLYWFVPFLAVMVQDSKEGFVLCGQCLGGGTAHPCRLCWVTKMDSSDPTGSSARFRFASENQTIVALLRGSKGLTNTQRAQRFSKLSILNVNSAFTDVPFGANPYGINGAAQADVLHQFLLGIMKRLVVNLFKLIVSKKDPSVLVKKNAKLKLMTQAPRALGKGNAENAEILKPMAVRGDAATGFELDIITMVLLGGVSIFGGRGTIIGVLFSILIVLNLRNGMALVNVTGHIQTAVIGILLIMSVLGPNLVERMRSTGLAKASA